MVARLRARLRTPVGVDEVPGAHRLAVYLSNLAPDELSRIYDDRIMSWLLCGTRFAFPVDAPGSEPRRRLGP